MRRPILLLLALALLLSGCARGPEPPEQPSLEALLTPDHLPEPPEAQDTYDPMPSSEVYVDESAYKPREILAAKYTRPEGDLSRYVPGQGPVYPYFAGERLFGFCSADGTLLTDPIFSELDSEFSVWTVLPRDEEDNRDFSLVSMDGSFSTDCRYCAVYYGMYDIEGTMECQLRDGYDSYDLLDSQGRVLISKRDDAVSITPGVFDDLLCVRFCYPRSENPIEFYYYYPDGQIALGPYRVGLDFCDGLACVSGDDSHYGYIDRSGNWVIEPIFTQVANFQNGRAVQSIDDRTVLLDTAGNIVLEGPVSARGETYLHFGDSFTEVCDRDGNVLQTFDGKWFASYELPDGVLRSHNISGCYLRRLDDPDRVVQLAPVELSDSPSPGAVWVDGSLIKAYILDDFEHSVRYWASEDLQRTGSVPLPEYMDGAWWGNTWSAFSRPYAGSTLGDLMTHETYYPVCEAHRVRIFREDGTELWTCAPEDWIAIINGRLCVITERTCTYYEQDGSVSFRFPYFVPLSD